MFIATEITTGALFTKFGFKTSDFLEYLRTLPWGTAPFKDAASKWEAVVKAQLTHLANMKNPKIDVEGAQLLGGPGTPCSCIISCIIQHTYFS